MDEELFIPDLAKSFTLQDAFLTAQADFQTNLDRLSELDGGRGDPRLWRISKRGNIYVRINKWGVQHILKLVGSCGERRAAARTYLAMARAAHVDVLASARASSQEAQIKMDAAWADYQPYRVQTPGVIGYINGSPISVEDTQNVIAKDLLAGIQAIPGIVATIVENVITIEADGGQFHISVDAPMCPTCGTPCEDNLGDGVSAWCFICETSWIPPQQL